LVEVNQVQIFFQIAKAQGIARRYFVVNGFDGALTMLGIVVGFYFSEGASVEVALSACVGAAVALGMSGVTSAYISERAEREKELRELEQAMVKNLGDSAHGKVVRFIPLIIGVVNGLSPLLISLIIIMPFWVSTSSYDLAFDPFEASMFLAFLCLFFLGVFIGKISGSAWLWSGIKTIAIAGATALIIYFVSS